MALQRGPGSNDQICKLSAWLPAPQCSCSPGQHTFSKTGGESREHACQQHAWRLAQPASRCRCKSPLRVMLAAWGRASSPCPGMWRAWQMILRCTTHCNECTGQLMCTCPCMHHLTHCRHTLLTTLQLVMSVCCCCLQKSPPVHIAGISARCPKPHTGSAALQQAVFCHAAVMPLHHQTCL